MANSSTPYKRNREKYEALVDPAGSVPPQAVELEEAVLGALMLEKDSIIEVQDIVAPEAFYKETHQIIYNAILGVSHDLEPVDLYTVTERLKREGNLTKVGGASHLASLTQKVGSAAHVEFHARIIAQKYIQRELIRVSTEIQRQSYDESRDVTDLIDFAEGEIFKVSEGHIKRSIQSAKDIVRKAMDTIEEAAKNEGSFNGVPSGFTGIDRVTLGWQPSDMIIIAARPSMGKTAFTLTMARNMAVELNIPVAFFSLEMSAVQLMMRLIVAESGLDSQKIRSGNLTPSEWKHLEESIKPLANAPLFIDDTPAMSVYELNSKVRRLKAHDDIKLIIIDYLQLMTGPKELKGNREQEVSTISRTLKAIAKETNIPIIALSQLNRAAEVAGGNKRPQLSHLRESGAIEQDADIVAFIHRPEYFGLTADENSTPITPGLTEFIIAKHRNGSVETVKLRFRKEQAKFTDYDDNAPYEGEIDSSSINGISAARYEEKYNDDYSPF